MKHECDDERQQTSSRGGESGLAQAETANEGQQLWWTNALLSTHNAGKVLASTKSP